MNNFSIRFHSIHFPCSTDMEDIIISQEGKETLQLLYKSLKIDRAKARVSELFMRSLNESLFACCIPDGYVLVKCLISEEKSISFHGFLLRSNESLRTAWKLVRVQTLIMCAMDWSEYGICDMTIDEIRHKVSSAKFDSDYQNALQDLARQLRTSAIPFNFALTNYPLAKLPLNFKHSSSVSGVENIEIKDRIVIDERCFSENYNNIKKKNLKNERITLKKVTAKDYCNFIERMSFDKKMAKDRVQSFKEELRNYNQDEIWCFHYYDHENSFDYYEHVKGATYMELLKRRMLVSDILINSVSVKKRAELHRQMKENYENELKQVVKEERKLHGGFFNFLSGKKKGEK